MAGLYRTNARGIRKSSLVVTVAAAGVAEALYLQTVGTTNPRRFCVRKIAAYLNVDCIIQLGIGLAPLVPIMPAIPVIGGFLNTWWEDEIPEVWVNADLTVQSDVLGVALQVETA